MQIILRVFILISVCTLTLSAESWHLKSAAGIWSTSSDGTITETINSKFQVVDALNSQELKGYLYVDLRHPLPILPNLRFEYVDVYAKGEGKKSSINTSFVTLSLPSVAVQSDLTLTQYDAMAYYNLLDAAIGVTLDAGLSLKFVHSLYHVDTVSLGEKTDSMIPMLYLRGRYDLPVANLGVESDIKYITDGSSTVYDFRIKVDYTLEFIPLLHPGVELGYRQQSFDIDGENSTLIAPIFSGDTDTNIAFSGLYGGVTLNF